MSLPAKRELLVFLSILAVSGFSPLNRALAAPEPGAPGDFGLGAMFGAPTGLSMKYWYSSSAALDGGLAWHFGDDDRFQIHADHLWHIPVAALAVPNGRLPFY